MDVRSQMAASGEPQPPNAVTDADALPSSAANSSARSSKERSHETAPSSVRPQKPLGTRTLRLDLQFDGTDFSGWQRQTKRRTVQGEVERALEHVLGAPHRLLGCGRTDAGVHARLHVASTRTRHDLPAERLLYALDATLPNDVSVLSVADVHPSFHPMRDAYWKWYRYVLLVSRTRRPLHRRWAVRVPQAPSLEALNRACTPLRGTHDFVSFANRGSTADDPGARGTVRTIHYLAWHECSSNELWMPSETLVDSFGARASLRLASPRLLVMDVLGDGFFYKMVRTLAGTLLKAAGGDSPFGDVEAALCARDRRAAGKAMPAAGLTLMAVGLRGDPVADDMPLELRAAAMRATAAAASSEEARFP